MPSVVLAGYMLLRLMRGHHSTSLLVEDTCAKIATLLEEGFVARWAAVEAAEKVSALGGGACTLAEFVLPAEIPAAGISAKGGQVAFPWGCGPVPLPDGPSLFVLSHAGKGVLALFMGEALEAAEGRY